LQPPVGAALSFHPGLKAAPEHVCRIIAASVHSANQQVNKADRSHTDGDCTHHEGEDAEVDDEGEQEHTHCASNMVKQRPLDAWVEEHLAESTKVHYTCNSHVGTQVLMY
jgi:hypothetical protein